MARTNDKTTAPGAEDPRDDEMLTDNQPEDLGSSTFDPLPKFEDSLALFRRAQGGDGGALNELFERYYDRIYRIVRIRMGAKLRGVLESHDIVQQKIGRASCRERVS
jgi:hypothetical protein